MARSAEKGIRLEGMGRLVLYAGPVLGYGAAAILATLEFGIFAGFGLLALSSGVLLMSRVPKLSVIRYVVVSSSLIAVFITGLHMTVGSSSDAPPDEQGTASTPSHEPREPVLISDLGIARPDCPTIYQVTSGDSLGSISEDNLVNPLQLQLVNGIKNPSLIREGELLYLSCPPSGDRTTPGQEAPDDRVNLSIIAGTVISCLLPTVRSFDAVATRECLQDVVLGEASDGVIAGVETVGFEIEEISGDFACLHGHVLQTDAFVDGTYGRISGVVEVHLGGGLVGRSLRLLYAYELVKIGSDWLVSNWRSEGVEPADQPVGVSEVIVCG